MLFLAFIPSKYKFLLVGIISGICSGLISIFAINPFQVFAPGYIFGICISIAIVLFTNQKPAVWKHILWALGSMLAYRIALEVTISLSNSSQPPLYAPVLGGAVGVSLVILFFSIFLFRIKFVEFYSLSMLGGLLGLSLFIPDYIQPFALFIVWQSGIAFGLGIILDRNKALLKSKRNPSGFIPYDS